MLSKQIPQIWQEDCPHCQTPFYKQTLSGTIHHYMEDDEPLTTISCPNKNCGQPTIISSKEPRKADSLITNH